MNTFEQVLDDIINYGIYQNKIDSSIIDSLNNEYFQEIDRSWVFKERYNQYFKKLNNDIGFNEILGFDVVDLISSYYNKQSAIRDTYAVITMCTENVESLTGHATKWHTDYCNSVALMILMNDISLNDPHMQFSLANKQKNCVVLKDKPENIKTVDCIGDAGTYFLFDNGHYFHRMNMQNGNPRKTIHTIFLPADDIKINK